MLDSSALVSLMIVSRVLMASSLGIIYSLNALLLRLFEGNAFVGKVFPNIFHRDTKLTWICEFSSGKCLRCKAWRVGWCVVIYHIWC